MPTVRFTRHLVAFFPALQPDGEAVEAATVAEAVAALDARHPGLASYLVDESGHLRRHVNIFVDGGTVRDRAHLSDAVGADTELFVVQALSGG